MPQLYSADASCKMHAVWLCGPIVAAYTTLFFAHFLHRYGDS